MSGRWIATLIAIALVCSGAGGVGYWLFVRSDGPVEARCVKERLFDAYSNTFLQCRFVNTGNRSANSCVVMDLRRTGRPADYLHVFTMALIRSTPICKPVEPGESAVIEPREFFDPATNQPVNALRFCSPREKPGHDGCDIALSRVVTTTN